RHGVGGASRGPGGRLHAGEVVGEEADARAGGEPGVEARGLAQGGGPAAADPDRRAAGPMRLRLHRDVLEREVLAAEAGAVLPPQGAADLDRPQEASDAAAPRQAPRPEPLA